MCTCPVAVFLPRHSGDELKLHNLQAAVGEITLTARLAHYSDLQLSQGSCLLQVESHLEVHPERETAASSSGSEPHGGHDSERALRAQVRPVGRSVARTGRQITSETGRAHVQSDFAVVRGRKFPTVFGSLPPHRHICPRDEKHEPLPEQNVAQAPVSQDGIGRARVAQPFLGFASSCRLDSSEI